MRERTCVRAHTRGPCIIKSTAHRGQSLGKWPPHVMSRLQLDELLQVGALLENFSFRARVGNEPGKKGVVRKEGEGRAERGGAVLAGVKNTHMQFDTLCTSPHIM
jgi:hypothetical protein